MKHRPFLVIPFPIKPHFSEAGDEDAGYLRVSNLSRSIQHIFHGGKGNDVIDAGWGSDIIIFNEGWGSDVVDKTCHHSKYDKGSTIGAADRNYKWEYTNFIVFGPNILSKYIIWDREIHESEYNTLSHSGERLIDFNFEEFVEAISPAYSIYDNLEKDVVIYKIKDINDN